MKIIELEKARVYLMANKISHKSRSSVCDHMRGLAILLGDDGMIYFIKLFREHFYSVSVSRAASSNINL